MAMAVMAGPIMSGAGGLVHKLKHKAVRDEVRGSGSGSGRQWEVVGKGPNGQRTTRLWAHDT
jgi:hypothetical protein